MVNGQMPEYARHTRLGTERKRLFLQSAQRKWHGEVRQKIREVAERLADSYPLITIDGELGEPRLSDTRFAVANVLTAITVYQDLSQVIDEYEGRYTEEQIIQAVEFARDFLNSFYRYEASAR